MEACWAHNPKVPRSKLGLATFSIFFMSRAELLAALECVTSSNSREIQWGRETISAWMKRRTTVEDLVDICCSLEHSVHVRVFAGQLIYKALRNKKAFASIVATSMVTRLMAILDECHEPSIIAGYCRIIARLIGNIIKPPSIVDIFSIKPVIGLPILSELALEADITEKDLNGRWASEILTGMEHAPILNDRMYSLLILWVPFLPKLRLVSSSILRKSDCPLYEDFLLEVTKQAPDPVLLKFTESYLFTNPVIFVDLVTNLSCCLPDLSLLVEALSQLTLQAIDSSSLELLEHIIGFWELCPVVESCVWIVASIGVYPPSFESWREDDMERFVQIRRDVRDCLRLMAKSRPEIVCRLFAYLDAPDWQRVEGALHALSAVAKFIPEGLYKTPILDFGAKLNVSSTHRAVLGAFLVLVHVYGELRTRNIIRLCFDCLSIPHAHPAYPFAAKQDHSSIVALSRCELDVSDYDYLEKIPNLPCFKRNLTRQSVEIFLSLLGENLINDNCCIQLSKYLSGSSDVLDLISVLYKCPYTERIIANLNLPLIVNTGPADAVPMLFVLLARKVSVAIWGPLVVSSLRSHAPWWTCQVSELFEITKNEDFVFNLSTILLSNLGGCSRSQITQWIAFLQTNPVKWDGRENDLKQWLHVSDTLNNLE